MSRGPEQRLRLRREIAAVYRRGEAQRGSLVTLRILRTNLPVSRFGFAVRTSAGNAVVRNRIRRRLREVIRTMPIGTGFDVMLAARPGAGEASFQQLRADVESALWRGRLLEAG